jgi:hypothetical protein
VRRCIAALLVLVLAFPAAPIAAARGACDRCPVTCPMHRKAAKLGCHSAGQAAHRCAKAVGLSAPGCGPHREAATATADRALAPEALVVVALVAHAAPRPAPDAAPARAADPPDSPPPILSLLG